MPENSTEQDPNKPKRGRKRSIVRATSTLSDGQLAERTRVWARFLEENLSEFQTLDSSFDLAFIAQWRADASELEGMPTNELMEDLQQEKQAELQQKRKAFFGYVSDLEFYIKKAFPSEPYIADEFGLHKLRTQDAKRGVRDVVIGFAALQSVNYYSAELLAAGMPAGFPAELEAALGDYADAEVQHQYSLLESLRATNKRIKAFNALYAKHRLVATAAEAVFEGDEVKMGLFR
jgi:hypothetical protein